jgi:hypothetical protein
MISNFSELKSAIYAWLLKDTNDVFFTSDRVDDIIYLAEAEMSRRLRIRELKASAPLVTTAGNNAVTIPSNYREAVSMYHEDGTEIQYASPSFFSREGLYGITGKPIYFYIDESSFILGAIPAASYNITVDYYKNISNLTVSNTTNSVLTSYPEFYLYVCLKHAYIASQDMEKEATFEARIEKMLSEINKADSSTMVLRGARGVARNII